MTFKEFIEARGIEIAECLPLGIADSLYRYSLRLKRAGTSAEHAVPNFGTGEGNIERWARDTNAIAKGAGAAWDHDAVRYGKHLEARGYRSARGAAGRAYLERVASQYRPDVETVLYCIATDAQSVQNVRGFEDWASEMGYDTDSRKAESIYRACCDEALALQRWLGLEAYAQLIECTEE